MSVRNLFFVFSRLESHLNFPETPNKLLFHYVVFAQKYSNLFSVLLLANNVSSILTDFPVECSATFHYCQNNSIVLSHYDCEEPPNVRHFHHNQFDGFNANRHDIVFAKADVDIYIRAEPSNYTVYQCSLYPVCQKKTKLVVVMLTHALTMTATINSNRQRFHTMPLAKLTINIQYELLWTLLKLNLKEVLNFFNLLQF